MRVDNDDGSQKHFIFTKHSEVDLKGFGRSDLYSVQIDFGFETLDERRWWWFITQELPEEFDGLPIEARLGRTLLFIDVDAMTLFNKRFGIEAGDIVLRNIAECLRSCPEVETCGLIRGDSFFALLKLRSPHIAYDEIKGIWKTATRAALSGVDVKWRLTTTAGYATYSDEHESPATWIERAAAALTSGKHRGGKQLVKATEFGAPGHKTKRLPKIEKHFS